MNALETLHGFQLDDKTVLDNKIEPLPTYDTAFVRDRDWLLPCDAQSPDDAEFVAKGFLIDGLQETGAKMRIHLNGGAKYLGNNHLRP